MELIEQQTLQVPIDVGQPAVTLTARWGHLLLAYPTPTDDGTDLVGMVSTDGRTFRAADRIAQNINEWPTMFGLQGKSAYYFACAGDTSAGQIYVAQPATVAPAPCDTLLPATSATSATPAMTAFQGRVWIAWTDEGKDGEVYLASAPWGSLDFTPGRPIQEGCCSQPSLAVVGGRLAVVWSGNPNRYLNIKYSIDGITWTDKRTWTGETGHPFLIEDGRGVTTLAWIGTDSERHISFMASPDGGRTWSGKSTSAHRAQGALALAVFDGQTYMAWNGFNDRLPNVARVTGTISRVVATPSTLPYGLPATVTVNVANEFGHDLPGHVVCKGQVVGDLGVPVTVTMGGSWVHQRQVRFEDGRRVVVDVRRFVPGRLTARVAGRADLPVPLTLTGIPADKGDAGKAVPMKTAISVERRVADVTG